RLMEVVSGYLSEQGIAELARRYASNIANARWLWRNRLGAESIRVTVSLAAEGEPIAVIEDAKSINLNSFDTQNEAIAAISQQVERGLTGQSFVILYVKAEITMGYGQEVYPSQELILDTGNTKSKVLYQKNGVA